MSDTITILETLGPNLTKTYTEDGKTLPYGNAASFHFKEVQVSSLRGMATLLGKLHDKPRRCLVRGKYVGDDKAEAGLEPGSFARNNANLEDQPLHWFMIDVDGYKPSFEDPVQEPELAVLAFLEDCLPPCFRTASFYWHLSSSAGMPGKEGVLKCHLHFWSKTAYTTAQMHAWAKQVGTAIDSAVYRRAQVHYTADPIFRTGRIDPVPVRCGWHQGETDEVDLRIGSTALALARDQGSGTGGDDMKLVDPSAKDGLIGAFHEAFDAEQVLLEFLEGEFEQVSQRRYTWINGGGTPEGVWVHDDGMHVGSSHNTWPIDGIANLWDLVRVFKFGDQDTVVEESLEDVASSQVGSRPSDLAMKAWASELPELKQQVVAARTSVMDELRAEIAAAQDGFDLENTVAPRIRAAQLSATEREMLAQAVQQRMRVVAVGLPIAQVRAMLTPPFVRDTTAPDWAGYWVWVTERDEFMDVRTKQFVSERSFNAMHDRLMADYADADGNIPRASAMALDVWQVTVVSRAMYAPALPVTYEREGIWYVNTFRPDVMKAMPETYSKHDLQAIKIVEDHALLLLPDDRERALFLDYLSYCVKHPGKKIRWAPVLKGVEGDGKSAWYMMLHEILGQQNVRVLDSATLEKSDFTGWRSGQAFTAVEEMKLHGHNRYDVFNKLKTCLSNDTVEIHPKGKDPYTVPNTTNYLLFTNFDDGVPINDNDRRCMMLRSPFLKKEQLTAKLKEMGYPDPSKYFDDLFDVAIKKHAGALRKWFVEREPHPEFNPNGRAPLTDCREQAVDMSRRDDDDAIASVLEDGGFGIYPNLIALSCLNDALFNGYGIKLHTGRAKAVLTTYGFQMFSHNQVKWKGKNYRFYYRGEKPENPAALASELEAIRAANEVDNDFED